MSVVCCIRRSPFAPAAIAAGLFREGEVESFEPRPPFDLTLGPGDELAYLVWGSREEYVPRELTLVVGDRRTALTRDRKMIQRGMEGHPVVGANLLGFRGEEPLLLFTYSGGNRCLVLGNRIICGGHVGFCGAALLPDASIVCWTQFSYPNPEEAAFYRWREGGSRDEKFAEGEYLVDQCCGSSEGTIWCLGRRPQKGYVLFAGPDAGIPIDSFHGELFDLVEVEGEGMCVIGNTLMGGGGRVYAPRRDGWPLLPLHDLSLDRAAPPYRWGYRRLARGVHAYVGGLPRNQVAWVVGDKVHTPADEVSELFVEDGIHSYWAITGHDLVRRTL